MSGVRFDPGAVSVRPSTVGNPLDPATVVVGSPPQWADGSDATYATISGPDRMDAVLPQLSDLGVSSARVSGATLHFRGSQSAAASFALGYLTDVGDPDSATLFAGFELAFPSGGGLVEDFAVALTSDVASLVACMTSATPILQFQVGGAGAAPDLSVYEVWLEVILGTFVQPPLRQYPREDGLGASSARRVYPPPRSIQRSNRRGPSAIS